MELKNFPLKYSKFSPCSHQDVNLHEHNMIYDLITFLEVPNLEYAQSIVGEAVLRRQQPQILCDRSLPAGFVKRMIHTTVQTSTNKTQGEGNGKKKG